MLQGMLKTRPGNRHRGAWEFTPEHRTPKTTSNLQVVINVHLQPLYLCYYSSTPSPNTSNFSRRSKTTSDIFPPITSTISTSTLQHRQHQKLLRKVSHHLVTRTLGPGAKTARHAGRLISSWSRNHKRTWDREQGNLAHDHLRDVPPHRVVLPGLHKTRPDAIGADQASKGRHPQTGPKQAN